MKGNLEPSELGILSACGILIIPIFFIDITLEIGFVVSTLYDIPVMVCIWSPKRRTVMIVAVVVTLLTLIAVPLKPPGDLFIPLFNRPVSLAAVWSVAILVDRWKRIDEARKKLERDSLREREQTIDFLRLINESKDTEGLVKATTSFFQEQAEVEAVGIRLREGEDYPYHEARGFPSEFVRSEANLCSVDKEGNICRDLAGDPVLECMCGNVICGRFDSNKHFFTKNGSFWTNSTTELLASAPDADRQAWTRNRCNSEGYESVALIPLDLGKERLGLIQLNDRKKGRFDPVLMAKYEQLAGYLAVAVAKFRTDDELIESRADLNRAQSVAMTGSWRLDVRKNLLIWSDENHLIFGVPRGRTLTYETFLGKIHPDDRELVDRKWKAALCGEPYEVEHRIVVDGEVKWVRERAELEFRDGVLQGGFGTTQDITERKKAEKQLEESAEAARIQAEKLARSNAELKQFAYVASHDLQEPLRMVTAYLGLIEKNYRDQLDDRALKYLDFAVDGGTRARELIRDLLDYSRVESQAKPMQPTCMEEVITVVNNHLAVQVQEEGAIITHDLLPCIVADRTQMTNLLQNLISNAIKFHGEEAPRVHITSEDRGTEWRFSIRDNGIGIEPQYKDKIFVLFQRLHTTTDYPGTGIGLAIAKKIVERHGGTIWFESEPGKGSTFYFTVPKGRNT